MEEKDKSVDNSWKERAGKEKEQVKNEKEDVTPPTPDFNFFISTLALQASIFLGAIPNPATNKKEQNFPQAKFIIDTLTMLKEKTQGNLTQEEGELIENVLYELRMQYVSATGKAAQ
jgi:hypothetical protein